MPPTRTTKVTVANVRKANSVTLENSIVGKSFAKRKAENSPPKGAVCKKPAAFKDVHRNPLSSIHPNAVGVKLSINAKNYNVKHKPVTRSSTNLNASRTTQPTVTSKAPSLCKSSNVKDEPKKSDVLKVTKKSKSRAKAEPSVLRPKLTVVDTGAKIEKQSDQESHPPAERERPVTRLSLRKSLSTDKSAESSSLYISALEEITNTSIKEKAPTKNEPPLSEFDKELLHDPHQVSLYAMEIFEYLKSREVIFALPDYMGKQRSINASMRAVLVDWMVEVQESFELNHETLYLAVKVVDTYLSRVEIKKEKLQLVGAAALFLSCKYDERLSPLIDDFIYICDNAYTQDDLLAMEQSVLFHIKYELSFPISYSFLRRYARCARIQMPLLTLARYILELALMEYKTVSLSDSKQAAAALYLAFRMVKHADWNDELVYYTGYKKSDFKDIVLLFNGMLHQLPNDQLKVIRNKYSHDLFFNVAKTPLISDNELDLDK